MRVRVTRAIYIIYSITTLYVLRIILFYPYKAQVTMYSTTTIFYYLKIRFTSELKFNIDKLSSLRCLFILNVYLCPIYFVFCYIVFFENQWTVIECFK